MRSVLVTAVLLLLLAIDWAADPYQGTNPLSQPLSSTPVCCHSLVYRHESYRRCSWEHWLEPAGSCFPQERYQDETTNPCELKQSLTVSVGHSRVYWLMELRC